MQSFRARSQLLFNEVEEADEVRQQRFSDNEDEQDERDGSNSARDEVDRGSTSYRGTPRQQYENICFTI